MQIEWMFRAMRCHEGKADPHARGVLVCYRDTSVPKHAALVQFSQDHREGEPDSFWVHRDPVDVPELSQAIEFEGEGFMPYGRMPVSEGDVEVVSTVVSVEARPRATTR
jgi:hypothetical protein